MGDKFWITKPEYFANADKFNQTLAIIDKELASSKEDYIEDFRQNFIEDYPPAWMITEVLSFGNLNYIYSNIASNQLMKRIASYFGLKPQVFVSWLTVLANLRNICCHHARVTTLRKKYVERRLQTFDFRSQTLVKVQAEQSETTPSGPGPYIVCLDTSSSMSGFPEKVAKAICYGLILRSRAEKRACYLISYSIDIEVLNLADWEQQQEQIVNFLSYSFYGGTNLEPALKEALRMLQCDEYSLADVLVISDFEIRDLSLETLTAINKVREHNTLFHSLEVGCGGNNEVLVQFDVYWYYDHHTNNFGVQVSTNYSETEKLLRCYSVSTRL